MTAPAALSRARERMAVIALATAAFVLNLNTTVLGALLPFLPGDLVVAGRDDGPLVAAAAWASALGALATGPLADRYGRRPLLLGGLGAFAAASALHLWADSWTWLYAARALSGAAVGMAYACASALVAEVVPYERRASAMGIFTAGMFLAFPLGLPLAVELARAGSWRGIFAVQTAVALAGIAFAARSLPAVRPRHRWVDPRNVIVQPSVVPALLAVMLHVGSFLTTVQLSTRWLHETALVPRDRQMWLWVVLGFAAAVGSFGFSPLADRIGKRTFVLSASVALTAAFLLLARVESFAALLAVGLFLAVAASARTGPLQALTSGLVPGWQLGTLMGLRAFVMQLGVAGFAQLAPFVQEGGGFRGVLYAAAGCQVASYVAVRFGVREVRA